MQNCNSKIKITRKISKVFIKKNERAFTLVELIVAFGIAAILATMGLAAFASFNQRQALGTSQQNLANLFQIARSRALSQVKPKLYCNQNDSLAGYQIVLCASGIPTPNTSCTTGEDAELQVVCPEGTVHPIGGSGVDFSGNVSYDALTTPQGVFYFRVISGGVEGPAENTGSDITLKHSFLSEKKVITVFKDGKIIVR